MDFDEWIISFIRRGYCRCFHAPLQLQKFGPTLLTELAAELGGRRVATINENDSTTESIKAKADVRG